MNSVSGDIIFIASKDKRRINFKIDTKSSKITTKISQDDLDGKTVFCRCWKSNKVLTCYHALCVWFVCTCVRVCVYICASVTESIENGHD